jgi:hypothetical protein
MDAKSNELESRNVLSRKISFSLEKIAPDMDNGMICSWDSGHNSGFLLNIKSSLYGRRNRIYNWIF